MTYDLIIIGGGMSGLSVAHHFREKNILILEKNQLLSGASGNNAGFIISGFGEHYSNTARRWGRERAREIQSIHLKNHQRIRDLAAEIECDYNPSGSLTIALNEKEKVELEESFDLLREDGFNVEWITNALTGLNSDVNAIWNRDDASIDPKKFWSAVAAGLPVITNCDVMGIEPGRPCRIITSAESFEASKVIFCLNAYSGSLLPELKDRLIPLRGQIVEAPVKQSPSLMPVIADHGDLYWRFHGNHLIFGGLESLFPEQEIGIASSLSSSILQAQVAWISQNFDPQMFDADWKPAGKRFGTMAFTVDGFPIVGRLKEPNCFVLAGLCGLGHGYAMECASWLYEMIERKNNIIPSYCSSDRIESLPLYRGGDWRKLYEAWNH